MTRLPERPLVSCVMPTRDRRRFVPTAIELFLRQDYPERELLVLDDGDDPVADLIPSDPRIRYRRLPRPVQLGTKRNMLCELARGEIIAHWDDDDWSAPWRLSYQVEALLGSETDVCGLRELYFLDRDANRAWCYSYPPRGLRPWVAGGTMCYRKDFWVRHRFPEVGSGEDTRFLWSSHPRVAALEDSGFYVAMIHSANTSRKRPRGSRWQPVDAGMVAGLLGEDPARHGTVATTSPGMVTAPAISVGTGARQHVTVSIPYFGCKAFIVQAVQSVLAQTHDDLTVVVVNDGDPDPPWKLLDHIEDPRLVRFDLSENRGRYFADAVVLAAATSPYFAPHDADDWSEPDRLRILLQSLREAHAIGAVGAYLMHYDRARSRPECRSRVREPLADRLQDRALHLGLFEVNALRAVGGYYAGFRVGFDTLLLNLLQMTGPIAFVDEPLYHHRVRAGSLTSAPQTGMRSAYRRSVTKQLADLYTEARREHRAYLNGELDVEELRWRLRAITGRATSEGDRQAIEEAAGRLQPLIRRSRAAVAQRPQERVKRAPARRAGQPAISTGQQALLTDERLWGDGWSLERPVAAELAARLQERKPARILEVGSGVSTALLAAYAARSGAYVVSLEHDPRFARRTTDLLRRHRLDGHAEVVCAPLEPLACRDGVQYPWYRTPLTGPFDFLLIDGPPQSHGRQAVLFAVQDALATDWEAWLDDGNRDLERACVELWQQWMSVTARLEQVGSRGLWVLNPPGAAQGSPGPVPGGLALTLLTGSRPRLLQQTVAALRRSAPALLDAVPVTVLHNGTDPETDRLLDGYQWIDARLRHHGSMLPEGEATSMLMAEVTKRAGVDTVLHLEDDWVMATIDPHWLERAVAILRSAPDVGQVRLRHAGERVLGYHMVTRRPIEWRDREGWWYSPSAHFTFNPSIVRAGDLPRIFPAASENVAQERFRALGLATAQLVPGAFHHIGTVDSLRQRQQRTNAGVHLGSGVR